LPCIGMIGYCWCLLFGVWDKRYSGAVTRGLGVESFLYSPSLLEQSIGVGILVFTVRTELYTSVLVAHMFSNAVVLLWHSSDETTLMK
jgi:hypothetical protein